MKMIKVEEIAKKYKGYEVDEEKLKEFLTPPKPKTVWDLEKGDIYWYFSSFGMFISDTWNNYDTDIARRSLGNCFLTKEEAGFEIERRRVEAILMKYKKIGECLQGEKYFILYDFCDKRVAIYPSDEDLYQGTFYFGSYFFAEQAIKEAGEDNIKKYIFGVDSK